MTGLNDYTKQRKTKRCKNKQRKKPAKTHSLSWFFMTFYSIAIGFRRFCRALFAGYLLRVYSIH